MYDIDWPQWTHTGIHSEIQHTFIQAAIPVKIQFGFCLFVCLFVFFMHIHIVVSRPPRLFLLSSSSFVAHKVSTGSTTLDSHYFSLYCLLSSRLWHYFFAGMESNAGLLHDRWEVSALDHNPTKQMPSYKSLWQNITPTINMIRYSLSQKCVPLQRGYEDIVHAPATYSVMIIRTKPQKHWPFSFGGVMWTDRQTDRQTSCLLFI